MNKFADYLEKTSLSPDEIELLKDRMIMHDKIGNNQDYLGNGLTKDNNPKSANQFGAVETFNFERNDVDLKTLHTAGAIQIIKGLTTI